MKKLHLPVPLRLHTDGSACLELPGATVGDLLEAAIRTHQALRERVLDAAGDILEAVHVFVDARDIRELDGIGTPLEDGANVWLLPRVGGGTGAAA
ncbi:MAG: MoaD/ThiS family protein [Planctomycetota bacterium]